MSTFSEIKQNYFDNKEKVTNENYCEKEVKIFVETFKQNATNGINGAVYYPLNGKPDCHKEIYDRFKKDDLKGAIITSESICDDDDLDGWDNDYFFTTVQVEQHDGKDI